MDMDTCSTASEVVMATNENQLPSYNRNSLPPANFQVSHPRFMEETFEISTLQATQLQPRYQGGRNSSCHPDDALHDERSDSVAAGIILISNQQSAFMEMDNKLLHQYSESAWPATSTVFQTSLDENTHCRYPPSQIGGVRKRLDSNVQADCTCEECHQLFDTTPKRFPGQSTTVEKDLETTAHAFSGGTYMLARKAQFVDSPKKEIRRVKRISSEYIGLKMGQGPGKELFEHTKDVLRSRKATPISASRKTHKGAEESQQRAIFDPPDQDLRSYSEELGTTLKAQPVVTRIDDGGPTPIASECGSLTNKEVWTSRTTRKQYGRAEPRSSDHSSDLCIYRAARGCAVHPRSIAERVRRSRIAQRVKTLETKLPDSLKNTGKRRLYTDELLERSIFYIKWLQNTIRVLLNHGMTPAGGCHHGYMSEDSELLCSDDLYSPRNLNNHTAEFQ